ncbi:PREDICTED: uncharacterized protein LOC109232639 [Nicotiana attenuata]|uniref:uncharacterized protein LOC109232639 n=1 Tax=Nicotiana attenuata TaxID=49451 RepID=UPI0009046F6B|nr:PREDICTED: uncharacterized protein LOC109232639 [Nicotiana attenuata]
MKCITTTQYTLAINGGLYGCINGKRGLRQGDPISPLLFVICMEYFTRIMNLVAMQEDFAFHTKCKVLQMNHLCFANDVLMFCKGEYQAIVLMLRGLQSFSNASGLTTNAAKSNIFSASMEEQDLQNLCELTGYKRGTLPFRYLGVPISPKKLTIMDCEVLVDKMTVKIKSWGTRNLSYAGRVLLVNTVLTHIHTYWASIFVLPKKVIKSIIGVCRCFLWDGKVYSNKPQLVAWDLVCRTKRQGGLGVKDIVVWNEEAIAKYVWNIAAKTDNLWVRWVNHIYLKGRDWWQYKVPTDCSWYWRKICSYEFAGGYIQNQWLKANGVYTIKSGYDWMKGAKEDWPWRGWVWTKLNIPKHSMICWLVAHNRLMTKERVYKMGISQDSLCEICGGAEETINHLFFDCPLARRCIEDIQRWLNIGTRNLEIQGLGRRMTRKIKGKACRAVMIAALSATVYHIWRARNIAF